MTLPALRRKKRLVTVSPGSIVPLAGQKLSKVSLAPSGEMIRIRLVTVVVAVAELLIGLASASVAETVAEERRTVLELVATTMVTVALVPLAREPRAPKTELPEAVIVPWVVLLDTRVTL